MHLAWKAICRAIPGYARSGHAPPKILTPPPNRGRSRLAAVPLTVAASKQLQPVYERSTVYYPLTVLIASFRQLLGNARQLVNITLRCTNFSAPPSAEGQSRLLIDVQSSSALPPDC